MREFVDTLPNRLLKVLEAYAVCALVLFVGAICIENNVIPLDAFFVVIIAAIVLGVFAGSYLSVSKTGVKMDGYIFAAVFCLVFLLLSFMESGAQCFDFMLLKYLISVFCGTILGNLFGGKHYYKLRNSGRKRVKSTK